MTDEQQHQPQVKKDLADENTESLESNSAALEQEYQNFDDFTQRSSPDARRQLFGRSLHPDQIPLSEMEPELQKAIAQINPNERHDIACEFLKRLKQRGLSDRNIEEQLSLSTHQVSRMTADDVSKLAAFTYHTHPDVFQDVLAEQPVIVKFLSNPLVGAVLGAIALKWLGNRRYL
jgi:exopolyphosphatase/pppGpp-phosphohydrolase